MKPSQLLRQMIEAGATPEACAIALEAIEAREDADAERRAKAAERKRRERARKGDAGQSRDCHGTVAGQGEDAKEKSPQTPLKENTPPVPLKGDLPPTAEALEIYHAECPDFPKVQKLTAKRRAALLARLRDVGGLDGWRAACRRAAQSPFLTGDNDRGWRADFDFLTRERSFTKLMEGAYDRKPSGPRSPSGGGSPDRYRASADTQQSAWLRAVEEPGGGGESDGGPERPGGDPAGYGGPALRLASG